MKQSILNTAVQGLVLFGLMFSLANISEADELSSKLESQFDNLAAYKYLDYEVVEQAHADEYGSMRYLVMDFESDNVGNEMIASNSLQGRDLQNGVHTICSTVLKDQGLLRTLSEAGYDMVSVSFDRQSQYDCL